MISRTYLGDDRATAVPTRSARFNPNSPAGLLCTRCWTVKVCEQGLYAKVHGFLSTTTACTVR